MAGAIMDQLQDQKAQIAMVERPAAVPSPAASAVTLLAAVGATISVHAGAKLKAVSHVVQVGTKAAPHCLQSHSHTFWFTSMIST